MTGSNGKTAETQHSADGSTSLVQKFWNFCNTLRDDGMGYGDYLEQLTFLLFLKLAHEYLQAPFNRNIEIPLNCRWSTLLGKTGAPLALHYDRVLQQLGKEDGMLGAIFFRAENKIQDPAKLAKLVRMIDAENWVTLAVDMKGELYEGLLQKNAEDSKSGAGQYFTPRPLIEAIVCCVAPKPLRTIADPACGTGGFFLGAYNWLVNQGLGKEEAEFLKSGTFFGNEIVPATRRMCLMNLFLHEVGDLVTKPPIVQSDALQSEPLRKYDYVLANPPFGTKSSVKISNSEEDADDGGLSYERKDFWATTSNKQLNFVQHINSMLKVSGEAAVIVPDNVLFDGGVGEKIRRQLLQSCDVHTLLRLPTGIFYANSIRANVLFWNAAPKNGRVHTQGLWVYDLRTDGRFTLKSRPLGKRDLADFVDCYKSGGRSKRVETERFRYFTYEELIARPRANLDLTWTDARDAQAAQDLRTPIALHGEIVAHLEAALSSFREVAKALPQARDVVARRAHRR